MILAVDDGSYERKVGAPGGDVFIVNRLTPPRYPATLRAVRIYFHNENDGLDTGTAISVLSGTNPGGTANINPPNSQLRGTPARVGALGQFNEFAVPPVTIQSGDFVVGFTVNNLAGVFPMASDSSSTYNGRSYLSLEGQSYLLVNTIQGLTPGNFLIRAVID